MLGRLAVVLIAIWLLAVLTANTMDGFIHILIVLAVVSVVIRLIQRRRLV